MTTIYSENPVNEGKFLWSKLLEDVKENTSIKLPPQRCLLVVGEAESGKTTLISRLKNADDPKKSYGLEYQYIDVKDEDRDDQTKLGVYIYDRNDDLSNLLKYALNESNFADTLALIVVSMQEPWNIMEALTNSYDALKRHCERLKIDTIDREENKQSLVRHFQEYTEPHTISGDEYSPGGSALGPHSVTSSRRYTNPLHPPAPAVQSATLTNGGSLLSPMALDIHHDSISYPLPEGVLEHNLGIPIIVVVSKTDTMDTLAKDYNITEEHFDVIQMYIRKFCLARGAALFYTSVKEDKNCDLLKRYINHRVYGFPFLQSAYIVEKDCAFVPTGWDTLKKIKILEGNLTIHKGHKNFNEWITRPVKNKSNTRDAEVKAKDEQDFLENLNRELEKVQNRSTQGNDLDKQHKKSPKINPTAAAHISAMKTKTNYPAGSQANMGGEGVLANFFNSLLKKPNSPVHPGGSMTSMNATSSMPSDLENETHNDSNSASRVEVQNSAGVS